MQQKLRILLGFMLVGALVAGACLPAAAQTITTGTLAGTVIDAKKAVLPGATVVAVHVPTGTTYEAITQGDGHFAMPAVRVGGPYTLKASLSKFKTQEQSGIQVALGETRLIDFTLQLEGVSETVTVTAEAQIIDTTRAGTAANVSAASIEGLPTISRSIFDMARTSPFFNTTANSSGDTDMISVAGRNNRYNNMQIDGAVNNDVFGLASTGTPGGQTGTQPVSLDALAEIQLVVSSYDVRQGGFSGGGINAVTKSGTNNFHGTVYYFGRNQDGAKDLPGIPTVATPTPLDSVLGPFKDKQIGFSVGGPIWKNRAFFFTNIEWARKTTPSGFSADGTSGTTWSDAASMQQVIDIAKNVYGFNPGNLSEFAKPNNNNKIFVRGDFNLTSRHQLTFRTNYVDALADVGVLYTYQYKLPSNFYRMTDKMLSNVAQLNSSWGKAFNEFRITYQRERNNRGGQPGDAVFPEVRVDFPSGNYVYLGTEYSSHANKLNQDIVELTDDLTFLRGTHEFSIGTHNEFYRFYNLFIQYQYGGYRFSSAANFQSGIAQSYNHIFSNTSNPQEAAKFPVHQFGFYAGDKWRAKPTLMITYGVRMDIPRFPDTPHANPLSVTDFGYRTDITVSPLMWSPRIGFNYDMSGGGSRRSQLRGGIGIFTGRTPYVWLSNQYSNTGVDFTNLSVAYNSNNKLAFIADPNKQPTSVTGGVTGRQTINLVDPDYKYPSILRTNLGYDHGLGFFGLIGTAEFAYTKNLKEIFYQNINYVPAGNLPDTRMTFKKYDTNLNDVLLLGNTSDGKSWSVTYKVETPARGKYYVSGSYLYGRSYSRNDGTSSVALSNWRYNPIGMNINAPGVTISNYTVGHRVNLTATFPHRIFRNIVRGTASVFYNGQSGRPFSVGFSSDVNGDSYSNNDLLYIPKNSSEISVYSSVAGQTVTYDQLASWLNAAGATKYAGSILPRNGLKGPWLNMLDFRYALTIAAFKETKFQVTFDTTNFLNLLNKDWGWQYFGNFGLNTQIGYGGLDSAGKMKYNLSTITSSTYLGLLTRDDLRSRAQMQIGLRFSF
jgi:hypothetical protein